MIAIDISLFLNFIFHILGNFVTKFECQLKMSSCVLAKSFNLILHIINCYKYRPLFHFISLWINLIFLNKLSSNCLINLMFCL